jgi:hypothetical protein
MNGRTMRISRLIMKRLFPLTALLFTPLVAICGAAEFPRPTAQRGLSLPAKADGAEELYDLKSDPQETTDLAAKNPKMRNDLSAALRQHIQRGGATPWQKPPPGCSP